MCEFPPFDPRTSDGCSGGVRQIARCCCVEHDEAYWYGRTLWEKLVADAGLTLCIWREGWRRVTHPTDPQPYLNLISWALLGLVRGLAVALFAWRPFFGKPHKRR